MYSGTYPKPEVREAVENGRLPPPLRRPLRGLNNGVPFTDHHP